MLFYLQDNIYESIVDMLVVIQRWKKWYKYRRI